MWFPRDQVCCPRDDYLVRAVHYAYMPAEDRNHLRDWRIYRGLTQEKLAEEVGTTKAVISLLETEKRPLSSKWLRKFAGALDTTPGRILDVNPNEVGISGDFDVPVINVPNIKE